MTTTPHAIDTVRLTASARSDAERATASLAEATRETLRRRKPDATQDRQMLASAAAAAVPLTAVRTLLWVVLTAFIGLTVEVLWQFGYMGFARWAFHNLATTLLFVDLAIALTMVIVAMWQDAARHGRTFWPYVFLTLAFGSAGPLLYFALHLKRER